MVLVAISAMHALDRRPAINLAWEWVALGFVYLLLRNLPRTRDESSVLAGAMVATAFAVSVYGLYQVGVELPLLREANSGVIRGRSCRSEHRARARRRRACSRTA